MKMTMKRSISLLLTLVLCAGVFAGLSIGASAAEIPEERFQAMAAAAMAYYDKGHSMQYDGKSIVNDIPRKDGGKIRTTEYEPPEYATPHNTLYSVCSTFMHEIVYEAYGYDLLGSCGAVVTAALAKIKTDDPLCLYRFDISTGEDVNEAIDKMLAMAKPGDIFNTYSNKSDAGHAMMYVGDVLGDGKTYLVHCFGSHMDTAKQVDNKEYAPNSPLIDDRYGVRTYKDTKGGSIRMNDAYKMMHNSYGKPGGQKYISLLRPLNLMNEKDYPIPAKTRFRMNHPRFAVDRTLDRTRFCSYEKGETATLTLALSNSSKTAYSVPVTEKIPAGVKLKATPAGATVSGDTITWNVDLPAESEKTLTIEYEVTADRGTQIVFDGSSVGDIPATEIAVTVSGRKLNEEDQKKLDDIAARKYTETITNAKIKSSDLGDYVYHNILGLQVEMPTMKEIAEMLTEEREFSDGTKARVLKDRSKLTAEEKAIDAMIVPMFHGGKNMWNRYGHERMNDLVDMHVEPGDIILSTENVRKPISVNAMVYLGKGKYVKLDSAGRPNIVEEPDFFKNLFASAFFGIRPSLGYDDLHTTAGAPVAAAASAFKFTDVKESDWFYTYVRDLVDDGTVNGMTETTFVPNGTLTYGQALKLIALAVGEKEPAKSGTHWASGYLKLAKDKKWLAEDVNLDGTITRLALCKIAAKAKGLTEQPASNPFKDTNDQDVLALNKVGVINGMTATEFQPNGLLTRAQISKIIHTLRSVAVTQKSGADATEEISD